MDANARLELIKRAVAAASEPSKEASSRDPPPATKPDFTKLYDEYFGPDMFAPDHVAGKKRGRSRTGRSLSRGKKRASGQHDEDVDNEDSSDDDDLSTSIWINGSFVDILDYFTSKSFLAHLTAVTQTDLADLYPGFDVNQLNIVLKPWQIAGQEKLFRMANSVYRGALLGDPVGLGKTLTALLTALRIKGANPKKTAFILVVTTKSCTRQWLDEVRKHFKEGYRPEAIILKKNNVPPKELLRYDIVICSHGFLRRRYTEFCRAAVPNEFGGRDLVRMPFHTMAYEQMGRGLILILDESQLAKNPNSLLAAAVRSLRDNTLTTLCLSGTLVHNRWDDLFSQISFLPGAPFGNIEHFRAVFGVAQGKGMITPDEPRMLLLQRFLASIAVIRPKSVLNLPAVHHKTITFRINDPLILEKISKAVRMARACLSKAAGNRAHGAKLTSKAFRLYHKAFCLGMSPLTYREPIVAVSRKNGDVEGQPPLVQDAPEVPLAEVVQGNPDEDEARGNTIAERVLFRHLMKAAGARLEHPMNLAYDPDVGIIEEDDLDEEHEEDEDDDDNAENDGEDDNDSGAEFEKQPSRSDPVFALKWRNELEEMTDEEIYSPRVQEIMMYLEQVLRRHPTEKSIIASTSLMFLDVVREAIRRLTEDSDIPPFPIGEYDGTLGAEERDSVQNDFNDPDSATRVLLLSIAVGGTGLNIAGGSRLFICHTLWSPGAENQLIGRCYRMPQDKEVTVYHFHAEDSDFDLNVIMNRLRKTTVESAVMLPTVRKDEDPYLLPRVPTRDELSRTANMRD